MSEQYSIEWFKEVKRDNPKWLGRQALELMGHYEALEKQAEGLERANTLAKSFLSTEEWLKVGRALTSQEEA